MPDTGDTGGQPQNAPDWRDTELANVRSEAASRRVENNTLKTELTTATTQVQTLTTQKDEAIARAEKAELALRKQSAALASNVSPGDIDEFVGLLQGTTEDELKAHAAKLAPRFVSQGNAPAYDPSQGRGNAPANVPDDAESQFVQWVANISGTPLNYN